MIHNALGDRVKCCITDDGIPRASVLIGNGDEVTLEFAAFPNPFLDKDRDLLICLAVYGSDFTLYRAAINHSTAAISKLFAELEAEYIERREGEVAWESTQ